MRQGVRLTEKERRNLEYTQLLSHSHFVCLHCRAPQGVKLTEKERRDLEYKEQVYKLAVERKKQLGGCPLCAVC